MIVEASSLGRSASVASISVEGSAAGAAPELILGVARIHHLALVAAGGLPSARNRRSKT